MTIHSSAPRTIRQRGITFARSPELNPRKALWAAKAQGLRYRTRHVLQASLRGVEDRHGTEYQPQTYIYVEQV